MRFRISDDFSRFHQVFADFLKWVIGHVPHILPAVHLAVRVEIVNHSSRSNAPRAPCPMPRPPHTAPHQHHTNITTPPHHHTQHRNITITQPQIYSTFCLKHHHAKGKEHTTMLVSSHHGPTTSWAQQGAQQDHHRRVRWQDPGARCHTTLYNHYCVQ